MTDGQEACGRFACCADVVFDGREVRRGWAVLVRGETIEWVGPEADLPADVPVVSEPGCALIPGLIDTHVHFMRWQGPLYLAAGVTTVRDVGNGLAWILARRAEWPDHPWPRLLCLGSMIDGPNAYWPDLGCACADPDAAVAAVREVVGARGVDGVKLYAGIPSDWLGALAAAAHEAGVPAAIHCQSASALDAARAGVDEFFHLDGLAGDLWPDHPPGWLELWGRPEWRDTDARQQEAADVIAASGMTTTPTLAYWDSRRRSARPGYPPPEEIAELPGDVVRWAEECCAREPDAAEAELWERALAAAQEFVGLLLARGACVLPGSDVPCERLVPGRSLWRELALLADSGMGPVGALRAATSVAAERLGLPRAGRLAPGMSADIAFVRGTPTERIPDPGDVSLVIRAGAVFRPPALAAAAHRYAAEMADEPVHRGFRRNAGLL